MKEEMKFLHLPFEVCVVPEFSNLQLWISRGLECALGMILHLYTFTIRCECLSFEMIHVVDMDGQYCLSIRASNG